MPPVTHYIEAALGTIFSFSKGHDSHLLSQVSSSISDIPPTVTISSTELGERSPGQFTAGRHELLGENIFPKLAWRTDDSKQGAAGVRSWLLIVEDPDAPVPKPGVHGIFYDIPGGKTSIGPEDMEEIAGSAPNLLKGGFRYGKNVRGSVWIGPRPVISHGNHRYFFTIIGLNCSALKDGSDTAPVTKERLVASDGLLAGKVLCWGQYIANFERKLQ